MKITQAKYTDKKEVVIQTYHIHSPGFCTGSKKQEQKDRLNYRTGIL